MLFLTHWELNENMPEQERLQAAQKITSSGLFPPEGVNITRWDGTPDSWGIIMMEADNVEQVFRAISVWRAAAPGFFKLTRTAPASPIQEIIPLAADIQAKLASL